MGVMALLRRGWPSVSTGAPVEPMPLQGSGERRSWQINVPEPSSSFESSSSPEAYCEPTDSLDGVETTESDGIFDAGAGEDATEGVLGAATGEGACDPLTYG